MNLLSLLLGIISSVPEAIAFFNKIAPHIGLKDDVPQAVLDMLVREAPAVHDMVDVSHQAIATLMATHRPLLSKQP